MNSSPFTRGESVLEVDGVQVSHDGKIILRDISFAIKDITRPGMQQGQVIGLLAPSGMGKTTLINCLSGLQQPDAGSIRLLNGNSKMVKPGEVGVVMQNHPLAKRRTVVSNLMLAAKRKYHSEKEAMDAVREMLGRIGLLEKANAYPAQLSGGQRQRVSIAQQALCSGHFILMDEPFSGLDVIAKDGVCDIVQSITSQNTLNTIVVSTHDYHTAIAISDTLLVLGRDRDEQGMIIPGAKIKKIYDLADMGLAWHSDIRAMPEFSELSREIYSLFRQL